MMTIKPSSLLLLLLSLLGLAQLLHFSRAQTEPMNFLVPHNEARKQVYVMPLTWNTTLETYAKNYAVLLSQDCRFILSNGPYGENLFWANGTGTYTDVAKLAVDTWVSEKYDYDYNSNTCINPKLCGVYTQVVWKDTVQLGCAVAKCVTYDVAVVVCSYNPPGNIFGQKPY